MPRVPRPPRPPRLPPLRLSPIRSKESVALDATRTRSGFALPPFVRFDRFLAEWEWEQGEHLTIIGPTGSGKTRLARRLLGRRQYVVVYGVKNRDAELYGPFQAEGYQLVRTFDALPEGDVDRRLFVPRTELHGTEARKFRAKRFRDALNDVYDAGGWTEYADDIRYMADQLGLAPDFEEHWILGRSEGVTVVASSQEPVDIPVMAYGQATHLFLFNNDDRRRADRMAELVGLNRDVARDTILRLPKHEFLYVNKNTKTMLRSKVIQ